MDRYVLIISVGPVQGFIAAARRSRDLWSGSWLLSEMSKAVAKYLSDQKAEMIFPYTEQPDKDLKAGSLFSVGNKIQVVINAENSETIADLAKKASEEAKKCFQEVAEKAFDELSHRHQLRSKIWDKQIDDYVETQAAWAKIGTDGYKKASEKAAQVLAARKATRDFNASAGSAFDQLLMIPKSSLDGARETVLPEEKNISYRLRSQLGLSDSEQLDCAGVAKRLGGDAEQFTPFTRVAAHAWIEALTANQKNIINEAYESLIKLQLATRVTGNNGKYANLPFDAQLLYPSRLNAEILQADKKREQDPEAEGAFQALNKFKQTLQNAEVWKNGRQPCPYGVLLLADGDRMGELLDAAQDEAQHKEITKALSAFAESVSEKMHDYDGHCIYAGGDDVLGFVPLYKAYACAKSLSQAFNQELQIAVNKLQQAQPNQKIKTPTLSVGLAIVHHMTPLGVIRELAKRAEKVAKGNDELQDQQRNALGITLAVRSGATTDLRLRWTDDKGVEDQAHFALENWVNAYREKKLPSRIAYDTRAIHLQTQFALSDQYGHQIQQAEFKRMLDKARTDQGQVIPKQDLEKRAQQVKDLNQLANELIIARWLAAKTNQDLIKE